MPDRRRSVRTTAWSWSAGLVALLAALYLAGGWSDDEASLVPATALAQEHRSQPAPDQPALATYRQEAPRGGHLRWHVVRRTVKLTASARPSIRSSSVALSQDERWLVVGGSYMSSLSVLDARTLRHERFIPVGGDATDQVMSVDGGRSIIAWASTARLVVRSLFSISINRARELFVLDARGEPEKRGRVKVGENLGWVEDLGDGTLLAPAVQGRRLSRIDLPSLQVLESVSTRAHRFLPTRIAVRSDQRIAVVTSGAFRRSRPVGHEILVLDPHALAERARYEFYRGLAHPRGALFHPDGRHILIADRGNDTLVVLDWVARRTVEQRPLGDKPDQLGLLPDGRHAWIIYYGGRERKFSVLDLATGGLRDIHLPGSTVGLNPPPISPDGRWLYVPVQKRDGIAVIDLERMRLADFIATPGKPEGAVLNRAGSKLYVTQNGGTRVSLLE